MMMKRETATLLVVDVQEKLLPAILDAQALLARVGWLIDAAVATALPVVFSEQYPKGLGGTVPELKERAPEAGIVDKVHFSCMAEHCLPASLMARPQVIVCGMESHVCVLQTVMQLLDAGKEVFVVVDAIGSRAALDHDTAIARMTQAGAVPVTREMVLFEMLEKAGTESFKAASKRFLQGAQPR
ncbi:hydrolase [Paludibacterium paludis]|uniref:Hydrolase n=1 Tax=Paludibacterium paludis TaxID=1225769 RepID=A0A918P6T3_9NEIS|nr:hydrolase [Paludibacterium paludis]GGY27263.1 hydrolase [Paludibacterium paludis]